MIWGYGILYLQFGAILHVNKGLIKNSVIFKIVKLPFCLPFYQWSVPQGAQSSQTLYYIRVRHSFSNAMWNRTPDLSRKQAVFLGSWSICSTLECNVVLLVKARVAPSFRSSSKKFKVSEVIFLQTEGLTYGRKFWRGIFCQIGGFECNPPYFFCQNLCNHIAFPFNKAGYAMPID